MGRKIQGYGDTFDPDTMKLLARAFDAAWEDLSRQAVAGAEDRRTRLALVILALAREGSRNEREIRKLAVKYMNSTERPRYDPRDCLGLDLPGFVRKRLSSRSRRSSVSTNVRNSSEPLSSSSLIASRRRSPRCLSVPLFKQRERD
jgi:hypothetical protein